MPPVAAADASKSTSSATTTTSTTTTTATATSPTSSAHSSPKMKNSNESTKLCHIVKRADFDGYGFNLHSEKSKPGQYIGKIDENSPAEAAGLMEGDRIIEVNGLPIGNETHKQVVQRIKAIAWEVKLLVIRDPANVDDDAAKPYGGMTAKTTSSSNSSSSTKGQNSTTNNGVAANNAASAMINNNTTSIPSSNSNGMSMNQTISPAAAPPSPSKISATAGESSTTTNNEKPVGTTLKLPSTAAEMRAILQSKKKYNPKSDDVNLQKKYEIIQKL